MNLDATVLLALALDATFGEPAWLYARVPHPVVFFGRLVGLLDRTLNREWPPTRPPPERHRRHRSAARPDRRPRMAVELGPFRHPRGWVVEAILASTLLAQRSL